MTSPFATKIGAAGTRKNRGRGENGAMSDNDHDDTFAPDSPSAVASSDSRLHRRTALFWAKVNKHGPLHPVIGTRCWLWMGALTGSNKARHGQVTWRARYGASPQKAHRVAWELTHGPIPADKQLNHHCDVPTCCNPEHVYLGTQRQNIRDASVRGLLRVPRTRKLSLLDRLTIARTPGYRGVGVDLARQYGVTKAAIYHIRHGRFVGADVRQPGLLDELAQAVELIA